MSVRGKWRVVATPDHDMAGPASYILLAENGGEFAFDCLTGSIHGRCEGDAVEFTWDGSDEMEPTRGHGWAEMPNDSSLEGGICLEGGDDIPFVAHRSVHFSNSLLNGERGRGRVRYPTKECLNMRVTRRQYRANICDRSSAAT
jgi:hypothetical protein